MPIYDNETNKQQVNPRTVVRGVKLQASYSKLALSQRIIMPFMMVFFTIMVLSVISYAYWFTSRMEQQMSSSIEGIASMVLHELRQEEQNLSSWARLIADRENVRDAVKQRNTLQLLQLLVSEKTTLEIDLIKVVNQNGVVLLDMGQPALGNSTIKDLKDRKSISLALSGMYPSDVVKLEKKKGEMLPVLVGLAPIKFNEEVIGAIEIGTLIKEKLLRQLDSAKDEYLVAFNGDKTAVASTLATARTKNWQVPPASAPPKRLLISGQDYLGKTVVLSGMSNSSLVIVLLKSLKDLNTTVQFLWLRLWGFFILGALLITFVGNRTARTISDPLLAVTKVAQKVTKESNFDLQVPVTSKDELGVLASSLNSLIRRVAEYTQRLEQARQNLERRVEERTHELSHKNQELNQAYDQLRDALHELQQTQAQLIQTEKMSSLGNMVAGVAHEINNPINFIYGNISHAKEYIKELLELISLYQKEYPQPTTIIKNKLEDIELDFISEDLQKIFLSMKIGAQRIREIILSLRNFSRLDEADMKSVNIHEGIDSTLLILNHQLKPEIEVIKEYANLPVVECYPAQLNQVFVNIISNAIDALREQKEQRHKQIVIQSEKVGEQLICVRIVDNGSGIEPHLLDKIFDPFFTTKDVGKGTGLGLWICYQIIQKHKGKIEVNSVQGQGTTFAITLPLLQSTPMGS
ncbi:MAG: ATP-binding protein [Heteroscytonema crispum UTEX LB 1556]